jgi:hypothetical protein
MNKKAYLDWFIGNKRVVRFETRPDHPCMVASIGERRQFNRRMHEILNIVEINKCVFDENPFIKRLYLKLVD